MSARRPSQVALPFAPAEEWRAGALKNLDAARRIAASGRDWESSYYHSGFAVELMLKACRMRRDRLPGWPGTDKSASWHDPTFAAGRCGLMPEIERESRANPIFAANWGEVKTWSPRKRYPPFSVSEAEARSILLAAANPNNGVVPWLAKLYARI